MKNEKGFIMIIFAIAIAIIIGIFLLLGIAIKKDVDYGIKEGKVVDKNYVSAYTSYIYSGKISVPMYHPEQYQIKLQKEINKNEKSIWISVDETTYHELNIGDYYPKNLDKGE